MPVAHRPPADFSEPQLRTEIATLAGHLNAAEARLLDLVAEMERRGAWFEPGIMTCAHWLSWKCGYGMNAAREKVRVALALENLPLVRERFQQGELSYSKARALTRVATPDNEDDLLYFCRNATGAQTERLIRAYRTQIAYRENLHLSREQLRARREFSWTHDLDGAMIIRMRLPPEEGWRVMRALDAVAADEANDTGEDRVYPGPCLPGERMGRAIERMIGAETSQFTSSRVTGEFSEAQAAANARRPFKANDSRLYPVCPRRVGALVRLAEAHLAREEVGDAAGVKAEIVVHIDADTLRDADAPGRAEMEDGPWLPAKTAQRLACDAAVVPLLENALGQPLDIGRRTRSVPPPMKRALAARDRQCRFPGCTHRHHLDAHHVVHWANGGETSLRNLVRLCHRHHRFVHEGNFDVHATDDGRFVFVCPDGTPIPNTPPRLEGDLYELTATNERAGVVIDEHVGTALDGAGGWDMGLAVAILERDDGRI